MKTNMIQNINNMAIRMLQNGEFKTCQLECKIAIECMLAQANDDGSASSALMNDLEERRTAQAGPVGVELEGSLFLTVIRNRLQETYSASTTWCLLFLPQSHIFLQLLRNLKIKTDCQPFYSTTCRTTDSLRHHLHECMWCHYFLYLFLGNSCYGQLRVVRALFHTGATDPLFYIAQNHPLSCRENTRDDNCGFHWFSGSVTTPSKLTN
jgi:hypothetical protein